MNYLPGEEFNGAAWQKARKSQPNEACVELARVNQVIGLRDTKLGDRSPILQFTPEELAAFLDGAKAGEFDHLL